MPASRRVPWGAGVTPHTASSASSRVPRSVDSRVHDTHISSSIRDPTRPNGIADPFTHDLSNALRTRHAPRNESFGIGAHTPSDIARAAPLIRGLSEPVTQAHRRLDRLAVLAVAFKYRSGFPR